MFISIKLCVYTNPNPIPTMLGRPWPSLCSFLQVPLQSRRFQSTQKTENDPLTSPPHGHGCPEDRSIWPLSEALGADERERTSILSPPGVLLLCAMVPPPLTLHLSPHVGKAARDNAQSKCVHVPTTLHSWALKVNFHKNVHT